MSDILKRLWPSEGISEQFYKRSPLFFSPSARECAAEIKAGGLPDISHLSEEEQEILRTNPDLLLI